MNKQLWKDAEMYLASLNVALEQPDASTNTQDSSVIGRRSTYLQVRQPVFVFLLSSTVGFGPVNLSVRGDIAVVCAAFVIIADVQSRLARSETTLCDLTREFGPRTGAGGGRTGRPDIMSDIKTQAWMVKAACSTLVHSVNWQQQTHFQPASHGA